MPRASMPSTGASLQNSVMLSRRPRTSSASLGMPTLCLRPRSRHGKPYSLSLHQPRASAAYVRARMRAWFVSFSWNDFAIEGATTSELYRASRLRGMLRQMHRSCSRRTSTWYDECPFVRSVTTVAAVASFGVPSCACCAVWMCASLTKRIGPEWLQAHRSRMAAGEHRRRPCRVGRVRFAAATSCACHRQGRSRAQRQMGLCNAASHGRLPHQRLPGR
jgi:hypothetical protein